MGNQQRENRESCVTDSQCRRSSSCIGASLGRDGDKSGKNSLHRRCNRMSVIAVRGSSRGGASASSPTAHQRHHEGWMVGGLKKTLFRWILVP